MARRRASLTMQLADIARIGVLQYLGNGRDYDGVAGRARNVTPAWNAVRDVFFQAERDLFENSGKTSEHPRWLPNNAEYEEWKWVWHRVPYGRPLELTGQLRAQLTQGTGNHYERATARSYEIGTNAPVGSWSGQKEGISLDVSGEDVGGLNAEGGSSYQFPANSGRIFKAKEREPIRITDRNVNDFSDVLIDYVFNAQRVNGQRGLALGRMYRRMTSRNTGRSYTSLAGRASRYERL